MKQPTEARWLPAEQVKQEVAESVQTQALHFSNLIFFANDRFTMQIQFHKNRYPPKWCKPFFVSCLLYPRRLETKLNRARRFFATVFFWRRRFLKAFFILGKLGNFDGIAQIHLIGFRCLLEMLGFRNGCKFRKWFVTVWSLR